MATAPRTPARKDDVAPAGDAGAAAPPADGAGDPKAQVMAAQQLLTSVVGKLQEGASIEEVAPDLGQVAGMLESAGGAAGSAEPAPDAAAPGAEGSGDVQMRMVEMTADELAKHLAEQVQKIRGGKEPKAKVARRVKALQKAREVLHARLQKAESFEGTETVSVPVLTDDAQVTPTESETATPPPAKPEGGGGNNFEDPPGGGGGAEPSVPTQEVPPTPQPTGSFADPSSGDVAKKLDELGKKLDALRSPASKAAAPAAPAAWPSNLNTKEFREGLAKKGPAAAEDFGRDPWAQ